MKSRYPFIFTASICALFLNKPDEGGGGGGDSEPKTLTQATAELKESRTKLATAMKEKLDADNAKTAVEKERDDAKVEVANLRNQFEALTTASGTTKTELTGANEKISAITKERDEATGKYVKSEENVKRLEALCGVKGVDPKTAVPATAQPSAKLTNADFELKFAAAKDPKARAAVRAEFDKAMAAGQLAKG